MIARHIKRVCHVQNVWPWVKGHEEASDEISLGLSICSSRLYIFKKCLKFYMQVYFDLYDYEQSQILCVCVCVFYLFIYFYFNSFMLFFLPLYGSTTLKAYIMSHCAQSCS